MKNATIIIIENGESIENGELRNKRAEAYIIKRLSEATYTLMSLPQIEIWGFDTILSSPS